VSALALALALSACGGQQKAQTAQMARFNAALCRKPPPEDTSLPLDPNFEGVKADLHVLSRTVTAAADLRLSLVFRNGGEHRFALSLPRQAFTLAGFDLVDHDCVRVPYLQPPTARALAYGNSGPMPLAVGESATIDSVLGDLAPGLVLAPGIYAIRLSLRIEPGEVSLRGRTVRSDWALFAVMPPK
jgi:hypothetical protein